MANRFLSNITINDAYTFPSADGTNGQVIGTDGAGNLSFVDQGTEALTLNVTVKNVSGGSLVKGTIVHAHPSANPPSGNVVEVIAADYDDATKMPAIGVLNETIANEAEGQAIMFGAVSGIDTSSFSAGDELWVGNDGAFTNTKPTTAGQLIQKIAVVIKSHASNGLIKIFGAGRTNDVPLPLYVDNANQRVGIGQPTPSYDLDISGNTRTTGNLVGGNIYSTTGQFTFSSSANNGEYISSAGNDIRFTAGGNIVLTIDGDDSRVGIGTTSPDVKLEVIDASPTDGVIADFVNSTNAAGTIAAIKLSNADSEACDVILGANRVGANFGSDFFISLSDGVDGTNQERFRITEAGNVGIGGVTEPDYVLTVKDQTPYGGVKIYGGNAPGITLLDTSGTAENLIYAQSTATSQGNLRISADNNNTGTDSSIEFRVDGTERMRIDTGGLVGIGTSSPSAQLHIVSDSTENLNQVLIESTSPFAPTGPDLALYRNSASPAVDDYLGALWFYGRNSAGEPIQYSGIYGRIVDTTDGTEDGSVIIGNTVNGSLQTVVTVSGDSMSVVGDVTANHYFADTHFRSTDTAATLSTTGAGIVYLRPNGYNQTTGQAYLTSGGVFNVTDRVVTGGPGLITSGDGSKFVQLGDGRTDNNYAYIDLIGDTTYTDYGLRVMRNNGGPNTTSQIVHRGTGELQLRTLEAAAIVLQTGQVDRFTINGSGGIDVSTNMTFGQGNRIIFPDNASVPDDPTNEQVDYITFGSFGSISQVSGRGALMITSSDDSLILANGEVGRTFVNTNIDADAEGIVLLSDGQVDIYSDLQDGWDGLPTPWYRLRYSGNVLTTYDGTTTYTYWNSNDDASFNTVTGDSITTDLIQKKTDGQGTNTYINLDDDAFYTSSPVNVLSIASISGMAFMTDTNSNGTNTEHFSFYTQGTTDATATKLFEIGQGGNVGIVSGSLLMGGTTVIDSSRNLTNIGTISSGDITISKAVATINMGYQGGPHGINFYDDSAGSNELRWGFYYRTTPDTITFETGGTDAKFTLDTSGNLSITGALKGPSTFYIDPSPDDTGEPGGPTTDTGTVVILGDLQVTGTTTTIDSTTLNVGDKNIVLAKDATQASEADGAGITIETGTNTPIVTDATLLYNSTNDTWAFNKWVTASRFVGDLTGTVTGSSSLNVLKTGDTMSGTLNINTSSGAAFNALNLVNTNTGASYVRQDFITDTIASSTAYIIAYGSGNGSDGSLAIKNNASHTTTNGTEGDIWFATGASSSDRLRIDGTTGDVRISEDLTVNGSISTNQGSFSGSVDITSSNYVQLKIDQTDSASVTMGVSSGTSEGFINVQTDQAGHLAQSPKLKFIYNDQGAGITEFARFTTTGLGIGTLTPSEALDVAGKIRTTGRNYTYGQENHHIELVEDTGSTYLGNVNRSAYISTGSYYGSQIYNVSATQDGLASVYLQSNGDIIFLSSTFTAGAAATATANEQMRIKPNGDVNALGSVYSQTFYDINATSYYIHPGDVSRLNSLTVVSDIRGNGQQLVLNAGESVVYATGQTGEAVYVNAEGGLQINSSPDNWNSGWAGKNTATICDVNGNTYLPGTVRHEGLDITSGDNIDQLHTFGMSFLLTANTWTDTGISSGDLPTGTFAVQVYVDDHGAGGGHYDEFYSGMMSWFSGGTNSTNVDEIVLHNAGHASNSSHIQLRTQRHPGTDGTHLMLQVKQNFTHSQALNGTDGRTMTFKFRRLI